MHLRKQIGWKIPDGPICNRHFQQTLPSGYHIKQWGLSESEAYAIQSEVIGSLKTAIIKSLNAVAPYKKRIVRGNIKPHLTSLIRKEIMTRSSLKSKANKSGKEEDLKAYKKQRNLVLKLNRKAKKNFPKSCISTNDKIKNKTFWSFANPFLQRRVRNATKILR